MMNGVAFKIGQRRKHGQRRLRVRHSQPAAGLFVTARRAASPAPLDLFLVPAIASDGLESSSREIDGALLASPARAQVDNLDVNRLDLVATSNLSPLSDYFNAPAAD